jgi:hypothetical protein
VFNADVTIKKNTFTHNQKNGIYRVYMQSNYNIGLVMQLLNYSSEAMTLTYLGLNQASREIILD